MVPDKLLNAASVTQCCKFALRKGCIVTGQITQMPALLLHELIQKLLKINIRMAVKCSAMHWQSASRTSSHFIHNERQRDLLVSP